MILEIPILTQALKVVRQWWSVNVSMKTSTFITEDKFRDCTNEIFGIILLTEKKTYFI